MVIKGGHGTQMAGLALYGDLTEVLEGDGPIELTHGLQSLKLIHPTDHHDPDLYGAVTIEGVSRLEVDATRRKIFCMAITTTDGLDRGRPSSWSAAIDNLAFGAINDTPRMILISAGNTEISDRAEYPESNETSSVHDPAQSWNALTVGGYTDRAFIDIEKSPGWTALATQGDLAPCSTTSVTWPRSNKTPLKPDIVMEAGNMGSPPDGADPDFLPELQMLTTNYVFEAGRPPLAEFRDTSAATALAANLACELAARYPNYRPETIRAFMVHSARWNDVMRERMKYEDGSLDTTRLLRTFGYGVPDPEMLFYSAQNNLTLVGEETIQPFFLDEDGAIKSNDINYHNLPWPREALEALPLDTPVEMRVTLSYFIEPSPGERGWDRKYGYPPLLSAFIRALSDLLINRSGVAIVATHSPVILQEVPASCVWKIVRHGTAARADRPEIETFGENVGVLTREVFGLEVTRSSFHRMIAEAVGDEETVDAVLAKFDNEVGSDGRALISSLIAARNARGGR